MIAALAEAGVRAGVIEGLTGVWVGTRKIGSIGLHVSRGVTTHGLAVNVNNDLQPFEWVVPCGIEGVSMTSLSRELGAEQDLATFADTLVAAYARVFDKEPVADDSVAA
jgi:lipoyl(octanoyl) transferase